jgi:hypothetical protein
VREHDVTTLTLAELERARRELAAGLALARPGSPVCVPIQAQLTAIDAELAGRAANQPDELPGSVSLDPARTAQREGKTLSTAGLSAKASPFG